MRNPARGRCSSLPVFDKCAGCWADIKSPPPKEEPNPAALLGTVVHAGIAEYVRTLTLGPAFDAMFVAQDIATVDLHEAEDLLETAAAAFKELDIHHCEVERLLEFATLSGHPDVYGLHKDLSYVVGDWKSGWADLDYMPALRGYAWLLWMLCSGGADTFTITLYCVWLRNRTLDKETMTAEDLKAWGEAFIAKSLLIDTEENPGAHCAYCRRRHECGSHAVWLQEGCRALMLPGLHAMTRKQWAAIDPYLASLKQALKMLTQAEKEEIRARGPLNLGGGYERAIVESHPEAVEALAAWPILSATLDEDTLAGCVRIRKKQLEAAVRAKAKRGTKAAFWQTIRNQLSDAGALDRGTVESLRRRKQPQKVVDSPE